MRHIKIESRGNIAAAAEGSAEAAIQDLRDRYAAGELVPKAERAAILQRAGLSESTFKRLMKDVIVTR